MITFFAGLLVIISIGLVAWPLIMRSGKGNVLRLVEDTDVVDLLVQKDEALLAINELETDHETGSLSDTDYQELRRKYEEKAMSLIKTVDEVRNERGLVTESNIADEIEERVSQLRAGRTTGQSAKSSESKINKQCPGCGALVQADASFCSHCGAALNAKCPNCSFTVGIKDRFCAHCGTVLGAKESRGDAG